jgi:hypothetical protein
MFSLSFSPKAEIVLMEKWLDISIAIFALFAAVFWLLSAYGPLPQMVTYLGWTPEWDPFYSALRFSAKMNTCAALLSGLSAFCLFIKAAILARR